MKITKMIKGLFVFFTLFFLIGIKKSNFISAQNVKDVTDGTKIKITNLKITRTNGNEPLGTIALKDSYEFKFDWDATAYAADLREGDYFTVQLPNAMIVAEEHANKELDIRDHSNNLVAKAVITPTAGGKGGGHIKFTFTNFVNTHGNVKGNFNMKFSLDKNNVTVNQKNNLGITVGTTFTSIKNDGVYIKPGGTQDPNEILGKWSVGRVMKELYPGEENYVIKNSAVLDIIKKGATRWLLRINVKQDNLQNVVISDHLHGPELGDITMIPGTFVIFEGVADENGSARQTKNLRNISDEIQLSSDKRSFTYNLGNVEQKTYFLVYYTTYPEGSRLKAENRAKLVHDNGSITKESSFKESIAGGGAVGDNANKIKIKKFDLDDPTQTLAGAKFELYESDKVTPVQHVGLPVVLETGNDGMAQSPTLIAGTYYLKEIKAPTGYLLPTEAGNDIEDKGKDNFYKALVTADGIQLFISNKKVEVSITGTKTWEDAGNQDGKRPEKITVILNKTVNGHTSKVGEKEVTKDNWTYAFNGLPKYENGNEITYSIEEVEVAGYTKEIQGYNLTNRYTPETINVTGTKTWEDGGNQDGKRPEKITVILKKTVDGQTSKVAEKEVTKDNWTYAFNGLPKYENGNEITYSIEEVEVAGYTKEIQGYNLTNRYTPETVNVTGTKTWEDAGNQDGKRPTEITIHLLKNGRQIATKKVTEADSWKWNFDNLDKYENGKEITYTVVEEKVKGYTSTVKGFDITNSYTPSKTSIQVTKAWDDTNDQDGVRPSNVTIKLLADGKDTGKKIVLAKDNNWTGNFTNLDEYKDGKKVIYSVSEETVGNGYTTVITGDIQKGFLVTNKRTPHTPPKKTEGELPNTGTDVSFSTLGIIALMAGFGVLKKQRRDGFF